MANPGGRAFSLVMLRRVSRLLVYLLAGFGLLGLLITFTPLVPSLTPRPAGSYETSSVDTIIVLAAATDGEVLDPDAYWRCVYAFRLQGQHPDARILLSGGRPENGGPSLAGVMAAFLRRAGVPPEKILTEDDSHSTRESALNCARMLGSFPAGKLALVTSDYHTHRAGAAFRRAGLNPEVIVVPFVEKLGSRAQYRVFLSFVLATEVVKYAWNRLKGWV
jgi:uncharacterized SAM-binding protein YcdF (DUF218 family)